MKKHSTPSQTIKKTSFRLILAQYLTFISLFVGAGFISGGIVHLGEGINFWDISLLIAGVILFVLGSYIQEVLFNKKTLVSEGVVPFLFYSLILSIGVGMASGGTQHFLDTPLYSIYLIPIGLFIGIFAFVLKQNIQLQANQWRIFIPSVLAVTLALFGILHIAAAKIPDSVYQHQGGHGHEQLDPNDDNHSENTHMNHTAIRNEADFIQEMIPHHEEAIESSQYMLTRVENKEHIAFLKNIVDVQTTEVAQMKSWHLDIYGSPYENQGNYELMMPDLTSIQNDKEVWSAYLQGMIVHHVAAVQMAEEIHTVTQNQEIHLFSDGIIDTQNNEIKQMKSMLENLR